MASGVGEFQPAGVVVVAAVLRTGVVHVLLLDGALPYINICGGVTVGVVVPRAAAKVAEAVQGAWKGKGDAQTGKCGEVALWGEGNEEVEADGTVGGATADHGTRGGLVVHDDATAGGEVGDGAVGGKTTDHRTGGTVGGNTTDHGTGGVSDSDEAVTQTVEALACPVLRYPVAEAAVVVGGSAEETGGDWERGRPRPHVAGEDACAPCCRRDVRAPSGCPVGCAICAAELLAAHLMAGLCPKPIVTQGDPDIEQSVVLLLVDVVVGKRAG